MNDLVGWSERQIEEIRNCAARDVKKVLHELRRIILLFHGIASHVEAFLRSNDFGFMSRFMNIRIVRKDRFSFRCCVHSPVFVGFTDPRDVLKTKEQFKITEFVAQSLFSCPVESSLSKQGAHCSALANIRSN